MVWTEWFWIAIAAAVVLFIIGLAATGTRRRMSVRPADQLDRTDQPQPINAASEIPPTPRPSTTSIGGREVRPEDEDRRPPI
ncbi:MAG TPA: hypothetical protein VKH35_10055 [Thermoanaerobaculia bacterium]|nr:hypothetical protein [Thermoanaerobaculia bacterium]